MEPPICAICGRGIQDFPDLKYDTVCFKETKEDKKQRKRLERAGLTDQPSNEVWFCGEHMKEAVKLKNKTVKEALDLLRKNLK
ncbi:MAG: hypothetical protein ABII22_00910 [Candidatus Micrarchaeota archaeon]